MLEEIEDEEFDEEEPDDEGEFDLPPHYRRPEYRASRGRQHRVSCFKFSFMMFKMLRATLHGVCIAISECRSEIFYTSRIF